MKLVEDATVVLSGANTTAIGANQIELTVAPKTFVDADKNDIGLAGFIDAEKAPRRGEEEVTYVKENSTDVVAYVPENVADISVLQGKTVDVIFGKDNEVAYVKVTDDVIDRTYVTAWDYDSKVEADSEIELNGEAYKFTDDEDIKIYVLGYEVDYSKADAYFVINDIMSKQNFDIDNPKKAIERNILVDVVLTAKDEIKSINFIGSVTTEKFPIPVTIDGKAANLTVTEDIVKKVTSTGKVTTYNKAIAGELEELDEAEVTVIKNGEVIKAEEIEAGNILTVLKVGETVEKIYVSDTTITGTLERVKNEVLTIDGEKYNMVKSVLGNTDGDFNKLAKVTDLVEDYLDQEVEVYLNFMGEVAAVVSETESVPATVGIITKVYEAEEDEDKDDVEYVAVKILSAETGKAAKYYIYNEDEEKDFGDNEAKALKLAEGVAVWFSADANNIIEYADKAEDSDILVIADKGTYEVDGKDLVAAAITTGKANEEKMEIDTFIFDDGITTYYNNHVHATSGDACKDCEAEIEIIAGWSSLVVEDTPESGATNNATLKNPIVLHDDNEVVFFIADVAAYATTLEEYAIVEAIDTRKEDGKTKTFVTLVGDATEYELKENVSDLVDEGDFVTYKLSDDKITVEEVLDAWTLAYAKSDDQVTVGDAAVKSEKAHFEVDVVDGRRVRYVEYEYEDKGEVKTAKLNALYLVDDTVTVYDLDNETIEKVDVADLEEVIGGSYAAGYKTDAKGNYDVIVLF